ncbi:MAG: MFS transporter [Chloroflexales bacterium]|nr:MFS transporter [Chloroflexales bacterium]
MPTSQRANPNLTLGLVCLAIFIGGLDLTVASAVLPKILLDFQVSIDTELNRAAWTISGYLLAYTVSMTFMGRLSDLAGRRTTYLVCLGIFIGGSIIVAAAPNLNVMIGGRVVQAFGAGAMVPISMALVGDLFPPGKRAPALGFIGAVDTAGWMVGHLYGGILMRAFDDWRLLFWINVPVGLIALGLTWRALRDVPQQRAAGTFDWLGALLISGSLIALNIGLAAGAELGATDFYSTRAGPPPYALPLVIVALALLAAFIWIERCTRDPLLDLTLFRQRAASGACAVNALTGFILAMAIVNVPLFINARLTLINPTADPDILRRAAWETGWVLSALTLAMALAAVPGGWLASRFGARLPTILGLLMALAGYLLMSRWDAASVYATMAPELILAGIGLGLVISPVADTVIQVASVAQRGSASTLVIMLRLVGMTIGVAMLTIWAVQRTNVLRQTGANDPLATSDPGLFLMNVAAQVIGETFLFGAAACLLALAAAWFLRGKALPGRSDGSADRAKR